MGKKRLEQIKATQPKNLSCLNTKNWKKHKHNFGIRNKNNRVEKIRRK